MYKPTASGRVTLRASSDPACSLWLPYPVRARVATRRRRDDVLRCDVVGRSAASQSPFTVKTDTQVGGAKLEILANHRRLLPSGPLRGGFLKPRPLGVVDYSGGANDSDQMPDGGAFARNGS